MVNQEFHTPNTFYPYQVSAESHIILPNELPFLPSTEKAVHFNFFFTMYTTTSPHLISNAMESLLSTLVFFLTLNVTKNQLM